LSRDGLSRRGGEKNLDAPTRFLAEAARSGESVHEASGLGDDHRLRFRWGHGAALRVEETVVHLALFGTHGPQPGRHPSEPPLHSRRGRDLK
jgi:hypothetical protein